MDIREIRGEIVDWIHPAQDGNKRRAVVNMAMNIWVP
jgi:hypothetical protein